MLSYFLGLVQLYILTFNGRTNVFLHGRIDLYGCIFDQCMGGIADADAVNRAFLKVRAAAWAEVVSLHRIFGSLYQFVAHKMCIRDRDYSV